MKKKKNIIENIQEKTERLIIIITPLMVAFLLGSFLMSWVLTDKSPTDSRILLIILFTITLIYYVYEQLKE